jgi:hypothetical protein
VGFTTKLISQALDCQTTAKLGCGKGHAFPSRQSPDLVGSAIDSAAEIAMLGHSFAALSFRAKTARALRAAGGNVAKFA